MGACEEEEEEEEVLLHVRRRRARVMQRQEEMEEAVVGVVERTRVQRSLCGVAGQQVRDSDTRQMALFGG